MRHGYRGTHSSPLGVKQRASGLTVLLLLLALPGCVAAMDLAMLAERAQALADQDWQAPPAADPALAGLSYDEYRAIRFDAKRALWADQSGFRVQFFHPGFLFNEPVQLHELDGDTVRGMPFNPDRFRFDPPLGGPPVLASEALGYAGFRVHYPINRPDLHDEFLVFLGASYFRLIGQGQVYGLSARGLALDSGGAGPEEFPVFREFWLQRPAPGDPLRILALLDSPAVTGAFEFKIEPGDPSSMLIDSRLFARRDLVRPGIAPLTSMFTHGETGPALVDDFRPRVHDSDGLLVLSSRDEAQWRPLANRGQVRLSVFPDDAPPTGFGLLQRRRDFADFQDLEARYDLRPGKWVEPLDGDWGAGQVELVEIPTADETFDNIVAFWVPERPILAGESRQFRYRLTTVSRKPPTDNLARVLATRTGRAGIPGEPRWRKRHQRRFVVDFHGPGLSDIDEVELSAETRGGELLEARLERMPRDLTIRAVIGLAPDAEGGPSDLRVFLHAEGRALSEVWTFVWYPDELDRQL